MKDNAALKKISVDQKRIALAATRDSAAMRVISVITILFLPATFTATLFSTTFFNFQVDRKGHVVSWWLWLYFLVTIFLSSIVLIWWYFTSNTKVGDLDEIFGNGDEELNTTPKA